MNPIRRLRLNTNLTQAQLAEKLGVTRQTIVDVESGLFNKIPPSVMAVFPVEERGSVATIYEVWQTNRRHENVRGFNFATLVADFDSFQNFCEELCGSVKGFSVALLIQPSIVRGYIKGGLRWGAISRVLSEVGFPEEFVDYLKELPRE